MNHLRYELEDLLKAARKNVRSDPLFDAAAAASLRPLPKNLYALPALRGLPMSEMAKKELPTVRMNS